MKKTDSMQIKNLILNNIIGEQYNKFDEFLQNLDFKSFCKDITLQEYQQGALKNALISLKLYNDSKENLFLEYKNADAKIEKNEINRASFWMATGSGKTIVMIKLMALLNELMLKKVMPKKPIMF